MRSFFEEGQSVIGKLPRWSALPASKAKQGEETKTQQENATWFRDCEAHFQTASIQGIIAGVIGSQ